MSAVAIKEIAGYVSEAPIKGTGSPALVEFVDDSVATSNLNQLVLGYGGSMGASHGIQIALQIEPALFIRKCCAIGVPELIRDSANLEAEECDHN